MRKYGFIVISTIINFALGIALLFVAFYAFIFISSYGVDVGEEMPYFYIPVGILFIIAYIVLFIVPNRYLLQKTSYNKGYYIIINLVSFVIGVIWSIIIFKNWS